MLNTEFIKSEWSAPITYYTFQMWPACLNGWSPLF